MSHASPSAARTHARPGVPPLGSVATAALLALWPALDNGRLALPAETIAPAEVRRGAQLIEQYQCGACHRIDGVRAAQGGRGPALQGFGGRSYIAGELPNTPALLARWIVDPPALVPATTMPALGVTPRDARAIAAYLRAPR